jgi:hypothetical protein
MSTKKFLTGFTTDFKSGRLSSDFIMGLIRKAAAWYTAFVSPWKDALEENKDWPGLHGHNEEDEGHPSYLATDGSEKMFDFPQNWNSGILSSSPDMMMDDIKEQGEKASTSSGRPHTPAMAGEYEDFAAKAALMTAASGASGNPSFQQPAVVVAVGAVGAVGAAVVAVFAVLCFPLVLGLGWG